MRSLYKSVALLLAAAAVSAVPGCEGGPSVDSASSSTTEADVSGKVTLGGKTAESGELVFDPTNIARKTAPTAKAAIGKNGSYSTKTLIGENVIYYRGGPTEKNQARTMFRKNVVINSGANTIDVDVP